MSLSEDLFQACREGLEDEVRRLLESGVNINAVYGLSGKTVLHHASKQGYNDIVILVLNAGADVNAVNKGGYTALHHASAWRRKDTVNLLLENGADFNTVNKEGKTALDLARSRGHHAIVKLLLDYLNKVNNQSRHSVTTENQASSSKPVAIEEPPVERADIGVPTQNEDNVQQLQAVQIDVKNKIKHFNTCTLDDVKNKTVALLNRRQTSSRS